MIPILYEQSETQFTSNGVGRLPDIISCLVTEKRNGPYECEFQYPITGHNYKEIREGRVIFCTHDNSKTPEPFDIYAHSAPINGIVTYNARHISYRLRNIILEPSSYSNFSNFLNGFKQHCLSDCPFSLNGNPPRSNAQITFSTPISVREALGGTEGSVLDTYGGEYKFERFNIWLQNRRGVDKPYVEIRYGKNMTDLTYELDDGDSYNAVVPFWENPDGGGYVMLPEKQVITDYSMTYFDEYWTDDGGNFMEDDQGNLFEFHAPVIKPVALDLSADFVEKPTVTQLRNLAISKIKNNKPYLPKENIRVDFVQLWEMAEYEQYAELQKIYLCDTVTVRYDDLGVKTQVKVIKTVYDSIAERYVEMELGDPKSSFADTLAEVISTDVMKDIISEADVLKAINSAVGNATEMLEGGKGGYVRYVIENGQTREILFLSSPNLEEAKYVIRINSAGIGFSRSGYQGPYTNAWTIDGKLSADWIQTGMLSSKDGSTFFDLNKGSLFTTPEGVRDDSYGVGFKEGRLIVRDQGVQIGGLYATVNPYMKWRRVHLFGRSWSDGFDPRDGGLLLGYGLPSDEDDGETIPDFSKKIRSVVIIGGSYHMQRESDPSVDHYLEEDFICTRTARFVQGITIGPISTIASDNKRTRITWAYYDDNSVVVPYIAPGLTVNGRVIVHGYVNASGFINTSDEQFKNIWQWDNRYDTILDSIKPILYTWKNGDDIQTKHVGVSAQKLQEALQNAGITDSGMVVTVDGKLHVNYTDLTMLLLKRVQEQQRKIDDLEARLSRLEALIADT